MDLDLLQLVVQNVCLDLIWKSCNSVATVSVETVPDGRQWIGVTDGKTDFLDRAQEVSAYLFITSFSLFFRHNIFMDCV